MGFYRYGAIARQRGYKQPGNTNDTIFSQTNSFASIFDGTSNTLLAGEKSLNLRRIGFHQANDNEGYASGWDQDTIGRTCLPPLPDATVSHPRIFGSSHPGGFNIVLCDGSVRFISYNVDRETWRRMGRRADGGAFQMP